MSAAALTSSLFGGLVNLRRELARSDLLLRVLAGGSGDVFVWAPR